MYTQHQILLAIEAARVARRAYLSGHKRGISYNRALQIEHQGMLDAFQVELRGVRRAFNGDEGLAAEFMSTIYTAIYGDGAKKQIKTQLVKE